MARTEGSGSPAASSEDSPLAPHVPLAHMPKFPKPPQYGDKAELSPMNFSPAKLKKWLDNNKNDEEDSAADVPTFLVL